jgi:uncharacterized protein YuzE
MRITYDQEVDAIYIRFGEKMFETHHLADGVAADYDVEGHLVGIELLDASKRVGDPKSREARQHRTIAVESAVIWAVIGTMSSRRPGSENRIRPQSNR